MDYQAIDQALTRLIRPQTTPLGLNILGPGDDPPDPKWARPAKYGLQISLCQWVTLARRGNRPVTVMAQDVNCAPCLAGLGLRKMKSPEALADYLLDMGYVADRELALTAAQQLDPLPAGEMRGVVIFPLASAPLEPDLVVIYGSPAQMARLASGLVHHSGRLVPSNTTGFGISCLAMMRPHWNGQAALVVPGRGERLLAGTEEGEMYLTLPASQMEGLIDGLEATQKTGTRYPIQRYMLYQPPSIPAFDALYAMMEEL